ncbi:hypothetical protein AB0L88_44340 [Saccharopolyspora shandongensis]|uniref:hypothetical protein n=1 Tax=Saccharopolyspora shandongensis TaxID=418495 RepID=UPI00343A7067
MGEKVPNRRLAALLKEAGLTNKSLAKRMRDASARDGGDPISPTHTNVEKWLSGQTKRPQPRTCHVLTKVLAAQLGRPVSLDDVGYGEVAPEKADTTLEYPTTVSDSIVALTQLTGYELRPSEQATKLIVVPEAWNSLLNRIMFGSSNGKGSRAVEPHPISEVDVQAVRDARVMFANFDYRYGGGRPKAMLAQCLETLVLPQIPHVSPETALGREYFREAAALARLAGWTCYDTGQHAFAQRYLIQAVRLALAANDLPLAGRILAGMSHQANFLGHYETAVYLARAAAHRASGHATPTTMALFHAMEARALSSQRNEAEATTAMLQAEKYLGQGNPENDPDWIRYFDQAELHAEFAHCFRDLNKPELATHHAATSIQESESLYVRSLSFCRTVLATSYLQSNELEKAVETAREVVDVVAQLKSFRVVSYLDDFRKRLRTQPDGAIVSSFEDYVNTRIPRTPGGQSDRSQQGRPG